MRTFDEIIENIPEETKKLVEKQGDIAVYVSTLLKKRGITQREFADKLEMQESRLSSILSGQINLTLKTIVSLEIALGEEIIKIPLSAEDQPIERQIHIEDKIGTVAYPFPGSGEKPQRFFLRNEASSEKIHEIDQSKDFQPERKDERVA